MGEERCREWEGQRFVLSIHRGTGTVLGIEGRWQEDSHGPDLLKGVDIIAVLCGFIAELYHPGPSQPLDAKGGLYSF